MRSSRRAHHHEDLKAPILIVTKSWHVHIDMRSGPIIPICFIVCFIGAHSSSTVPKKNKTQQDEPQEPGATGDPKGTTQDRSGGVHKTANRRQGGKQGAGTTERGSGDVGNRKGQRIRDKIGSNGERI